MKKHEGQGEFTCLAVNCKRKFYRGDKLKDHVQRGHDEQDFFACPVPLCLAFFHMNRAEMREHLTTEHMALRHQHKYKQQFNALGVE